MVGRAQWMLVYQDISELAYVIVRAIAWNKQVWSTDNLIFSNGPLVIIGSDRNLEGVVGVPAGL